MCESHTTHMFPGSSVFLFQIPVIRILEKVMLIQIDKKTTLIFVTIIDSSSVDYSFFMSAKYKLSSSSLSVQDTPYFLFSYSLICGGHSGQSRSLTFRRITCLAFFRND